MSYQKTHEDCAHYIKDGAWTGQCGIFNDLAHDLGMAFPVVMAAGAADKCKSFEPTQDYIDLCADGDELARMEPRVNTEVLTWKGITSNTGANNTR